MESEVFLFRAGLGAMLFCEQGLMEGDFEECLKMLRKLPVDEGRRGDDLFEVINRIHIPNYVQKRIKSLVVNGNGTGKRLL